MAVLACKTTCPHCRRKLRFAAKAIGKTQKSPACGKPVLLGRDAQQETPEKSAPFSDNEIAALVQQAPRRAPAPLTSKEGSGYAHQVSRGEIVAALARPTEGSEGSVAVLKALIRRRIPPEMVGPACGLAAVACLLLLVVFVGHGTEENKREYDQRTRFEVEAEEAARRVEAIPQSTEISPLPGSPRVGRVNYSLVETLKTQWRREGIRYKSKDEKKAVMLVMMIAVKADCPDPADREATLDYIQSTIEDW